MPNNKKELKQRLEKKYVSNQSNEWIDVDFSTANRLNLTIVSNFFDDVSWIEREEQIREYLIDFSVSFELGFLSFYTPEEATSMNLSKPSNENLSIKTWQDLASLSSNPQNDNKTTTRTNAIPRTVAFYSFKGGVGRTTALNHVAWLLAQRGRKVVAVDLDLEAPGLSTSFNLKPIPPHGIVDYFYDRAYLPQGVKPNIEITDIFGEVYIPNATGRLFIVPAGSLSLDYISKINDLRATSITEKGETLWQTFQREINDQLRPDIILIDSRTGINEWGAFSLLEAAKEAIIFLYPNEQNFLGIEILLQSLRSLDDLELNFVFSPVPDPNDTGKERANTIWDRLKLQISSEKDNGDNEDYSDDERSSFFIIPYLQPIALSDTYPYLGLIDYYNPIANLIEEETIESLQIQSHSVDLAERWEIIEDLSFPPLNAADTDQELDTLFQKTANFNKFLDETTCLIKGRKGTGKTALYFLLLKHTETAKKYASRRLDSVILQSGHGAYVESRPTRNEFTYISDFFTGNKIRYWESFWRAYLLLNLLISKQFIFPNRGSEKQKFSSLKEVLMPLSKNSQWESEHTEALCQLSTSDEFRLLISDALGLYNQKNKKEDKIIWLLYDDLDEDFPDSIRQEALTGLFQLIQACDARGWKNIRFKVFLREDIWNNLNFDNKSHFNGRDLILEWTRIDFLKLALRLATRSELFKNLLDRISPIADIDEASEEKVSRALDLLWGMRRRKGDKAKYVTRWVYERLTDSSGRTFPRSLSALLEGAKNQELTYKDNPSIQVPTDRFLRSTSLEEGLKKASEERCGAIKQEYPRLQDFFNSLANVSAFLNPDELKEIYSNHITSIGIAKFENFTKLLQDIGVIQWRDKEKRYRFADIYIYGFRLNY